MPSSQAHVVLICIAKFLSKMLHQFPLLLMIYKCSFNNMSHSLSIAKILNLWKMKLVFIKTFVMCCRFFKLYFLFYFSWHSPCRCSYLFIFFSNKVCFISFVVFGSVLILHTGVLQDFISVSDFFVYFIIFLLWKFQTYGRLAERYNHVPSGIIFLIAYDKGSYSSISSRSTLNNFLFFLT